MSEDHCDSSGCAGLTNPYGRTKWMCEAILGNLAASDPERTVVALRYFNPIDCDESGLLGVDPRGNPNNLIPVVVNALVSDTPALSIFGADWDTPDGTAIRDFIHVTDRAQGHLASIDAMLVSDSFDKGFHVFNLGTGTGHSVKETITAMETASGRKVPTRETGRREGDVVMCIAEPSKSATTLKWKTNKTLSHACLDIIRYLGIHT